MNTNIEIYISMDLPLLVKSFEGVLEAEDKMYKELAKDPYDAKEVHRLRELSLEHSRSFRAEYSSLKHKFAQRRNELTPDVIARAEKFIEEIEKYLAI